MGVTGLWRLIEPAGKPVPVETLENKVLAVDVSIWLHQMVKGYQDAKGAPMPNAHLIGLFQRLCKLLYFRIKPIFVFDGGFPELKKETIARRQDSKSKYNSESERLKRELALLLSKKTAINSLLGKQISPKKPSTSSAIEDVDLFKLPALPENKEDTESDSEDEQNSSGSIIDLHSVDIESNNFQSLPVKEKYDLLLELKETRKMNSWGKIHELPKKSDNFSDFQLQRLLKRRKVQECLQETEKEMGDGGMSLNDLESLLNEEGIDTKIETVPTRPIASNNTTRFLLINNVKQALADAKKKEELKNKPLTSNNQEKSENSQKQDSKKDELEDDLEKAIKMSLECVDDQDINNCTSKTDDSWTSVMTMTDSECSNETDSEEGDGFEQPDLSSAKAYIAQFSDYTNKAIDKIVAPKSNVIKAKPTSHDLDKILEEINREKSIIEAKIDLSLDEDVNTIDVTSPKSAECCTDLEQTQASVMFVGNSNQNIISLDSSIEDFESFDASNVKDNLLSTVKKEIETKINIDEGIEFGIKSESSEDEFEDVPELENETKKTVVQLELDMSKKCDEVEDIFADVFADSREMIAKAVEKPEILSSLINNKSEGYESKRPQSNCIVGPIADSEIVANKAKEVNNTPSCLRKSDSVSEELKNTTHSLPSNQLMSISNKLDNQVITSTEELNHKALEKISESKIKSQEIREDSHIPKAISKESLNKMAESVEKEENNLIQEKGRLDRIGRNITEQMTKEAQELLQIFGIPYIVAPMEAEAQCAYLETKNLTDGTITDDSDIWLFGGQTVYKNFFNQKKHVLQYQSERIKKSFNLCREQLILLALLVGSDYTTGVDGVGPVTAIEILASFPYNRKQFISESSKQAKYQHIITGLQDFKNWVRSGRRTDNTNLKKKLKNVLVGDDFPSVRVVHAYLEPNIEKSEEKFSWGEMDITVLREYTKAKFGWSQSKLDEIINPVLKRITQSKSQKTVHDYFKRKVEFQSLEDQMSKRVWAAVQKMDSENNVSKDLIEAINEEPVPPKKRKTNSKSVQIAKPGSSGLIKITSECKTPNVVASIMGSKSNADIVIPKMDRFQEIIPQREKDKKSLLENKMKAVELFRKTKIDRKKKPTKKKIRLPKEDAELSESSDGD